MSFPSTLHDYLKGYSMPKAYAVLSDLDAVQRIAEDINQWAHSKGFWKSNLIGGNVRDTASREQLDEFLLLKKSQKLMLVVSELSELLEELRKPQPNDTEGFTNEEIEVADAVIRLLDYAGQYGLRVGQAIGAKMAKNEGRPYMHGKAF